jgi:hypothetical protein
VGLLAFVPAANATPVAGENGRIVLASYQNFGVTRVELFLLPVPFSTGGGTLSPPIATSATQRHRHPTWSPDRTKIAFARGTNGGNYDIFVQDLTQPLGAGNPVNITSSPTSNEDRPAWAPNGTFIAFERDEGVPANRDIVVSLTNGGGQTNITNTVGAIEGKPAWNPLSSTIYYEKGNAQTGTDPVDIVRRPISFPGNVPTVGAETLAVADVGNEPEIQPSISPDGTKICYGTGYPAAPGTDDIKVAALTAAPAAGSTVSLSPTAYYCTWSPDSRMVAYTAGAGSTGDLVMVSADGSDPFETPLATGVDIQTNPDWAPDGRPQCPNLTVAATQGQPVSIPVQCNDTGPQYERSEVKEFITEQPQNGTTDQDLAGDPVIYTPNANFVGTDTFEISSFDTFGFGGDDGIVVINVTAPEQPPGGGGGADTTPPTGTLAGKNKQDVDKLKLTVGANEASTASGQAAVSKGGKRATTSKTATTTIAANGTAKLKFKFKRKTLKTIKARIEQGKKPKAAITVTATDVAGNQANASKTVKLKD